MYDLSRCHPSSSEKRMFEDNQSVLEFLHLQRWVVGGEFSGEKCFSVTPTEHVSDTRTMEIKCLSITP